MAAAPAATAAVVAKWEYHISLGLLVVVRAIAPKAIVVSLHPSTWTASRKFPGRFRKSLKPRRAGGQIEDAADNYACITEILTFIQPRRGASTSVTLAVGKIVLGSGRGLSLLAICR